MATVKFGGRNFADGRAFALARLYVYCYTLWNARASTTYAGYPGKHGTFRYSGSSGQAGAGSPRKRSVATARRVAFYRIMPPPWRYADHIITG